MSSLTDYKLQLPLPGVPSNWGSAINHNFIRLENKLREISSSVNALESLTGVEMNYIRMDDSAFFVNIYYDGSNNNEPKWILQYIAKNYASNDNHPASDDYKGNLDDKERTKYYTCINSTWDTTPPLYRGAFVANIYKKETQNDVEGWYRETAADDEGNTTVYSLPFGAIGLPGSGKTNDNNTLIYENFARGDWLVRTQKFGSIYNNYESVSFTKYPPIGEYHFPSGVGGRLTFTRQNYVDYHLQPSAVDFYLPNIGLSQYYFIDYRPGEYVKVNTTSINTSQDQYPHYVIEGGWLRVKFKFKYVTTENGNKYTVLNDYKFNIKTVFFSSGSSYDTESPVFVLNEVRKYLVDDDHFEVWVSIAENANFDNEQTLRIYLTCDGIWNTPIKEG